MTVRNVPPLPGKKPPVPFDFQLRNIFGGSGMLPSIPSITGGASGPATSGGIGEQGNIGAVTFGPVYFKNKNDWVKYAIVGAVILVGLKIWKR